MRMDEILSIPGKGFQGVGNYPKNFGTAAREFDIHRALNAGAIRHLRFPSAPAADKYLDAGVDVAMDLFFGDWWPQLYSSEEEKNDDIGWFGTFPWSLLLALLRNRYDEATRLCSWCHVEMEPEYQGTLEPEVGYIYLLIAGLMADSASSASTKLREKITQCRLKRPQLLLLLLDAVTETKQEAFEEAMLKSMKHFSKSCPRSEIGGDFVSLLALPQSILNMVARHRGMVSCELTANLQGHIITPESLVADNR